VNAYPHFFTETEAKIRLVYVRRNDNLLEGQAKRKG
jgi:hypothetical protein